MQTCLSAHDSLGGSKIEITIQSHSHTSQIAIAILDNRRTKGSVVVVRAGMPTLHNLFMRTCLSAPDSPGGSKIEITIQSHSHTSLGGIV